MKKIIVYAFILVLLAGLVGASLWYYTPVRSNTTMTMCALDGETIQVELELTFYRSFFEQTYARGEIRCNGETYIDAERKYEQDGYSFQNSGTFWEKVQKKYSKEHALPIDAAKGGVDYPFFINIKQSMDVKKGQDTYYQDYFYIFGNTGGLEIGEIMVEYARPIQNSNEKVSKGFYGPASTDQEAQVLHAMFAEKWKRD